MTSIRQDQPVQLSATARTNHHVGGFIRYTVIILQARVQAKLLGVFTKVKVKVL